MTLDGYTCVLCGTGYEETLFHLFFTCPFSVQCWSFLRNRWNLSLNISDLILHACCFSKKIFREISIVASWCIWTHRNSIIFDRGVLSFDCWKGVFKEEFALIIHRAKSSLNLELEQWFCNFV
uniref:Reverse transcriptase zinc-binding domain-containing protein n=1 Tax=Setaria viridis TaxID=4556 RepID=A0A4U6VNL0_SETVI|nr:hypothetical protein SEVIR_2G099200v2 [Setaria viridis]